MAVELMFKSKILNVHAIILIVGLLLVSLYFMPNANAASNEAGASADGGKRIVKWVDSSGATHYGDKLPSQEAGRNNTEMNTQGVVVKRNVKTDTTVEQVNQDKLASQRKDNILLASYTNADEIDLARDRNLQMDQAALQALTAQKENVSGRLARNQKTADSFNQGKKPLPAYLNDELKLAKSESNKVDKQIAERKLSMDATRKRYAEEKARFIALKQASTPEASAMTAAPAETTKTNTTPNTATSLPATKLQSTKTIAPQTAAKK